MKRFLLSFIILSGLFFPSLMRAYVMSSPNYRMQSDSLNIGGAESSSTNYGLSDTAGEIATGESASNKYVMHAGFQAMQQSFISITAPPSLNLSPMIGSISGGIAGGNLDWRVLTDNPAGYSLSIKTTILPALRGGGNFFNDYVAVAGVPDFQWSVSASSAGFGYSPEGQGVAPKFLDNGVVCGQGGNESVARCWAGLSQTPETLVKINTPNGPSGTTTTIRFQAESGVSHTQPAGNYSATIIITAIPQ